MSKGGGTKMVTSTTSIPEDYKNFAKENLQIAELIGNRPYLPYQGERIAPFSPDQNAAFDTVRGLQQQYLPAQRAGEAATTAAINSITDPSVMMAKYTNPYEQDVITGMVNDVRTERDKMNALSRLRDPSGSARQALVEAENNKNYLDSVGKISNEMRSQNFRDAARLGQSGTGQLMQGGSQLTNQAGAGLNMGTQFAGALSGIGQQTQGLRQALNDLRYSDFIDQYNAPLQNLSIRQSALGQTPMGSVSRQPVTSGGGIGSTLSGVGGLLSGIAAICWVAREVYGSDNPKWLDFRSYLFSDAPKWLFNLYVKYGERFAEYISDKPRIKKVIRWAMDKAIS